MKVHPLRGGYQLSHTDRGLTLVDPSGEQRRLGRVSFQEEPDRITVGQCVIPLAEPVTVSGLKVAPDGTVPVKVGGMAVRLKPTTKGTLHCPWFNAYPSLPLEALGIDTSNTVEAPSHLLTNVARVVGQNRLYVAGAVGVTSWIIGGLAHGLFAAGLAVAAGLGLERWAERNAPTFDCLLHGPQEHPVARAQAQFREWMPFYSPDLVAFEGRLKNGVHLSFEEDTIVLSNGRQKVSVGNCSLALVEGGLKVAERGWELGIDGLGKLTVPPEAPASLKFPSVYETLALSAASQEGFLEGDEEEILINDFAVARRHD